MTTQWTLYDHFKERGKAAERNMMGIDGIKYKYITGYNYNWYYVLSENSGD